MAVPFLPSPHPLPSGLHASAVQQLHIGCYQTSHLSLSQLNQLLPYQQPGMATAMVVEGSRGFSACYCPPTRHKLVHLLGSGLCIQMQPCVPSRPPLSPSAPTARQEAPHCPVSFPTWAACFVGLVACSGSTDTHTTRVTLRLVVTSGTACSIDRTCMAHFVE
jgi:hypothetical protein